MKNLLLALIGLGVISYLMFNLVYEPNTELKDWCKDFIQKDNGSIDEPLMKTLRQTCKEKKYSN